MASVSDFPARGKVIENKGTTVVFAPAGTTYQLHLIAAGGSYDGPVNVPVHAVLRATARKLWTVPSGGNFVEPIYGRPRVIQGRVRYLDERTMVVLAGAAVAITLPAEDDAFDLSNGPITAGSLVNVVVHPGTTIELVNDAAHRGVGASVH